MPTNFSEIADYHTRIADQHHALAQAAEHQGNLSEAGYHAELAARYDQAAQEQRSAMQHEPGSSTQDQKPRHWPLEPPPASLAASGVLAVLRGAGHVATAIRQSISRRNPPSNGPSQH
jgi:hypothetical protein